MRGKAMPNSHVYLACFPSSLRPVPLHAFASLANHLSILTGGFSASLRGVSASCPRGPRPNVAVALPQLYPCSPHAPVPQCGCPQF